MATAESEARYFAFELSVLQTAFAFKKAHYQLSSLDARIAVNRETLRLTGELEKLALIQNEVGKVTSQDVLRARIEQERLTTDIANLDDSRQPLLAQFKASLGLKAEDAPPPMPQNMETTPLELERLLEAVQRHWLLRKYVNKTNPQPLRPLPAREEQKPVKALRSPGHSTR